MKKYGTNGKVKERVIRYESSTQRVVWNSKKSKLRRMSTTGSAGSTGVDDNAIALSEMTGIALGAFPGVCIISSPKLLGKLHTMSGRGCRAVRYAILYQIWE